MIKCNSVPQRLTLPGFRHLGRVLPPAVTVLLPAEADSGLEPVAIRIRRAVDDVFHRLFAESWSPHEVGRLIAPALSFSEDAFMEEERSTGLALFVDRKEFHCFEVPVDGPEVVCVGCHYFIRPFLRWLTQPQEFLILELAESGVQLVGCTDGMMTPLPLPRGVPGCSDDISALDTADNQRAGKGHCGRGKTNANAISFGISSANPQKRLQFFCTMVDRALHGYFSEQGLPLVLAGADHLVRAYRRENTYEYLVPCSLKGHLSTMPASDVMEKAQQLIQRERTQDAVRHLVEMEEYAPGERWSASLPTIVREAAGGRVWRLFLAENAEAIGDFRAVVGEPRTSGRLLEEDLLNAAAVETLQHGGEVFFVDSAQLPDHAAAAALFRYSLDSDLNDL